jgi:hypothetical protein
VQHPADFLGVGDEALGFLLAYYVNSSTYLKLCLEFRAGGMRGPQVLYVKRRGMTRKPFGNIRGHRQRGLAHLVSEHRLLVSRQPFGDRMTRNRQVHRFLPDEKVAKGRDARHDDRESIGAAKPLR